LFPKEPVLFPSWEEFWNHKELGRLQVLLYQKVKKENSLEDVMLMGLGGRVAVRALRN